MTDFIDRRTVLKGAAAAGASLIAAPAIAQANYPSRPITMVCPWGAGGGTDATARIVAQLLEKDLGQPVNVVNRTGGSGVVGQQPNIDPGQSHTYSSGAVITTRVGTMQGSYQMFAEDGKRFDAEIAPFRLAVPGALH